GAQPMPSITCPNCGRGGSIKRQLAPGAKVRCKGCNRSFEPAIEMPVLDCWEPDGSSREEPAPPTTRSVSPAAPFPKNTAAAPQRARPWYRDPILQFAVAFPLVAALAMGAYLLRERAKASFREDTLSLKAYADQARAAGKLLDAHRLYSDLVVKS